MKMFKIQVTEIHECHRTYFVEAENKTEAKKKAKDFDYYDADQGHWVGTDKVKVNHIEEEL